jgi:DNA repair protein RecO (recombination protein O)
MNLIKLLTAESQANKGIYDLINNFFYFLDSEQWIKEYIFWELELLKLLGYDLDLKKIVEKEITDNKIHYYVKSNNDKKNVPNFLIDNDNKTIDIKNLLNGLKLVSDYLEKSILRPNNINYPNSRSFFVSLLK